MFARLDQFMDRLQDGADVLRHRRTFAKLAEVEVGSPKVATVVRGVHAEFQEEVPAPQSG